MATAELKKKSNINIRVSEDLRDKMDADLREMYPKVGSFKLPDVPPLNN